MEEIQQTVETLPLPADLQAYEDHLEQLDPEAQTTPLVLPTLADAQRALARVRHFRKQAADVDSVFASEIAAAEAEVQRLKTAREDALKPWQRRESWYTFALEQFARAQLAADPKLKTIKLPAGELTMRAQQPEWNYGDDLVDRLKEAGIAGYIRVKEEVDKAALKKVAQVREGRAVVIIESTGEVIELPISVTERPPKFDLKV